LPVTAGTVTQPAQFSTLGRVSRMVQSEIGGATWCGRYAERGPRKAKSYWRLAILNTGAAIQTVDLTPALPGHDHAMECERIWDEGKYRITSEGLAVTIPGYGAVFLKYRAHN